MQRRRGRRSRRPAVGEHLPVDPSLPQLLLRLHLRRSTVSRAAIPRMHRRFPTCGARSLRESRDCRSWRITRPSTRGVCGLSTPITDYPIPTTVSCVRCALRAVGSKGCPTISSIRSPQPADTCSNATTMHWPTPKPVRRSPCGFSDSSAAHPYRAGISLTNIEIRFVSYFWVKSFAGGAGSR